MARSLHAIGAMITTRASRPADVARTLAAKKDAIVAAWTARVLGDPNVPEANRLSAPALRDHVPGVLDRLVALLHRCDAIGCDAEDEGRALGEDEATKGHAENRHRNEYELGAALRELSHLRLAIVDVLEASGLDYGGEALRVITSAIDESMRTTAESMHAAATAELRSTQATLARQVAIRERFVAILAHDLRGPLQTVVLGAKVLVQSDGLEAGAARTLARILRAGERMGSMVAVLLDFARIEHGEGIPTTFVRTDARDVIDQAIEEAQSVSTAADIQVVAPASLHGVWDGPRLVQALSNLLRNAIEHGAGGPVVIRLEPHAESVTVRVENDSGGTPIAHARVEELFEPFQRLGSSRHGLGLGLYIASAIVRAHRGTIRVESDERTTSFVVELPCDARAGPPHARCDP